MAEKRANWVPGWVPGARTVLAAGILTITGCVSRPAVMTPARYPLPDVTVYFYPTRGQSADLQDRDRYDCNAWAVRESGFDPSAPLVPPHLRTYVVEGPPPGSGVAAGAMTGAVLGSMTSPPWEAGRGAFLGALLGAVIGGIGESAAAEQAQRQAEANAAAVRDASLERQARNYQRAMRACLEGRGYTVR